MSTPYHVIRTARHASAVRLSDQLKRFTRHRKFSVQAHRRKAQMVRSARQEISVESHIADRS